jgi:hypothetical protein
MINTCGVDCKNDCELYDTECTGCNKLHGKVFWTVYYNMDVCPIYNCAVKRELETCGKCGEIPCKTWFDTRDPSLSDEEFNRQIESRLKNLGKEK